MGPDIDAVLDALTLPEKLQLVHGAVDPDGRATGYLPGVERLDVPPLGLVDGPLGVRALGESATAFPASIALAASWDPDLAREFGAALGRETAAHGQQVILAPGVNIVRVPTGGRNFEYYSEDPHLTARVGVGTVEGVQSEGVAATVKHYVANNQEANRYEVSADVSERALRECYLPAFRAAVEEADVAAVMTAYNRVNGTYAGEHERLLTEVLRSEWGFDGFVMSDWWGTRSTVAAANAGLDVEMPGVELAEFMPDDASEVDPSESDLALPPTPDVPALFGDPLAAAVERGDVAAATVDEKVERVLRTMAAFDWFEDTGGERAVDTEAHDALARRIATEGTVLLENDGALPLESDASVAVVGPNADAAKLGGGGSSEVTPRSETSPVEGVRRHAGTVTFERGVERVGESSVFGDGGDDAGAPEASLDDAVAAAADADATVVVLQDDASEFVDREGMGLPGRQDELVAAVAEAAEQVAVVLRTSGPVELPWLDAVDAVLQTWYPGQADGDALGAVLFGDAEPGGRLPVTFGASPAEYPTAAETAYPGVDDVARYDEGVFVGYRYFDREGTTPVFPFGHGGSYASFDYGEPSVTEDEAGFVVEVPVENTADRSGKAVVQVYADVDAPVPTPDRELAGFETARLDPGESARVGVTVPRSAFEHYDEAAGWTLATGDHRLLVGRSSRDVVGAVDVTV